MSHTFRHQGATFIHDSDLSGDVTVRNEYTQNEVEVSGDALLAFVADYVRRERIARLEDCGDHELLGLPQPGCAEDE